MSKSIHFIGIGGIGMSGIAHILLQQGCLISGSDIKENANTQRLQKQGARISIGHSPDNITQLPDLVVYSSAISSSNPELITARERQIPVLKRAEVLADLMRDKIGIAVAGAHGKTTTTSLASFVLEQSGLMPTVVSGGIVKNFNDNALLGHSNYFVAEMDESDGSFLYFHPTYAILTNIDYEHVDFYHSWDNILDAYRMFLQHIRLEGCLFACGDNEHVKKIVKEYDRKYVSFGLSPDNDFTATEIIEENYSSSFRCLYKGNTVGNVHLPLPGTHNISNTLGVIALALELGIHFEDITRALAAYEGVQRRFQIKACINGITLIDDYGHHPTEIKATLQALYANKPGNAIVIFQPHRYTRTKFLLDEFVESLRCVENLILTDIYSASEKPIEGISALTLYEKLKAADCKGVQFIPKEKIVQHVSDIAQEGDVILTLGAGDIGKISDELLSQIKEKHQGNS
ncbi:UDP-N-acetylmuramate--L-alanine ligase [Candidatus Omnitrophota bacterium]